MDIFLISRFITVLISLLTLIIVLNDILNLKILVNILVINFNALDYFVTKHFNPVSLFMENGFWGNVVFLVFGFLFLAT